MLIEFDYFPVSNSQSSSCNWSQPTSQLSPHTSSPTTPSSSTYPYLQSASICLPNASTYTSAPTPSSPHAPYSIFPPHSQSSVSHSTQATLPHSSTSTSSLYSVLCYHTRYEGGLCVLILLYATYLHASSTAFLIPVGSGALLELLQHACLLISTYNVSANQWLPIFSWSSLPTQSSQSPTLYPKQTTT